VFSCVDFVILLASTQYSALDIFNSLRGCLLPLVLCGVILAVPLDITHRRAMQGGTVLFIAAILVSAVQYITETSVLPTRSQDGTFAVQSPIFYGHARAFSLFTSGYQAGLFYCIPAAIGVILLVARRRPVIGGILLSLSVFGSYATMTRLTMLSLGVSVLSVIMLSNPRFSRVVKTLPLICALGAIVTISTASPDPGKSAKADISSTESLGDRVHEWRYYGSRYMSGDLTQKLYGTGMSEYAPDDAAKRYPSAAPVPIDNAYLQLLLHGGLLSLAVVVYFYIQAWRMLLFKATTERSLFTLAAAAVFSTTPLVATFNDLPVALFTLFTIAMMVKSEAPTSWDPGHVALPRRRTPDRSSRLPPPERPAVARVVPRVVPG
jgi:hypothetical protein